MELFGIGLGAIAVVQAVAWTLAATLFPVFWVWMLVDAILRDPSEYPASTENSKIVWVILIAVVQFVAIAYFVMVYAKVKRTPVAARRHTYVAQAPVQPGTPAT